MARCHSPGPAGRSGNTVDKAIVDTSVWVDHFRGRLKPILRDGLETLLLNDQAMLTDIILHEILVGAVDEKHYQWLSDHLSVLSCLSIPEVEKAKLTLFGFNLRRKGFPGKYTDLTIAYLAQKHDFPLLTFDGYFKKLSSKGIIRLVKF